MIWNRDKPRRRPPDGQRWVRDTVADSAPKSRCIWYVWRLTADPKDNGKMCKPGTTHPPAAAFPLIPLTPRQINERAEMIRKGITR